MKKALKETNVSGGGMLGPSSRITDDGTTEAEKAEKELRQYVLKRGIEGISVAMTETPLSKESIIIDPNDMDKNSVLSKCFYIIVICSMNSKYDFYLYEHDSDSMKTSKPLTMDKDLSLEEIKARIAEFLEAYKEILALYEKESDKPIFEPKPINEKKQKINEILNKMFVKKTFKQRTILLKETMVKTMEILRG